MVASWDEISALHWACQWAEMWEVQSARRWVWPQVASLASTTGVKTAESLGEILEPRWVCQWVEQTDLTMDVNWVAMLGVISALRSASLLAANLASTMDATTAVSWGEILASSWACPSAEQMALRTATRSAATLDLLSAWHWALQQVANWV